LIGISISDQQEAVMTDPRETQRDQRRDAGVTPEVHAEVIQDLDLHGQEADEIGGGRCHVAHADAAHIAKRGTINNPTRQTG
jgi:hypothetical protein